MMSSNSISVFVATLTVAILGIVTGFPHGAPEYSCRNLIPGHINGTMAGPPPYRVRVTNSMIMPGESTTVVLESTADFPFRGFLCSASDVYDESNSTLGRMSYTVSSSFSSPQEIQTITCSRSTRDTAVTHRNKTDKFRVEFDWMAPVDTTVGRQYKLRCSVVMTFWRCWTNLQTVITIGTSATSGSSGSSSSTGGTTPGGMNGGTTSSSNNMNNNNNNNNSPGVSDPSTQGTSTFPPSTSTGNNNGSPATSTHRPNNAPTIVPSPDERSNLLNRPAGFNPNPNTNTNPNFPAVNPNVRFDPSLNSNNVDFNAIQNSNGPFSSLDLSPNAVTTPRQQGARGLGNGRGQGNPNRNRNRNFIPPQNVINDNSNTPRDINTVNPDPFFDTSFLDNDPANSNLLNRNLIRPNERFVDPNAITFDFPSAFFLTPGAIRRFQQRNQGNLIFRDNQQLTEDTLSMFQEF